MSILLSTRHKNTWEERVEEGEIYLTSESPAAFNCSLSLRVTCLFVRVSLRLSFFFVRAVFSAVLRKSASSSSSSSSFETSSVCAAETADQIDYTARKREGEEEEERIIYFMM